MNCLAEARFIEILDRGGLDATLPDERIHLEACESCRESWAAVAAAGEVLAEARPKTARGRLVPVMIAAAMLLTIVGVIVWKSSSSPVEEPRDAIVMLLEGTPEDVRTAREALLKQGRKAIPGLIAARPRFKGSARLQVLQDLIFDLKRAAVQQDPEVVAVFHKLATMRLDMQFENTKVEDIVSFIRDFSGLNVHVDRAIDLGVVDTFELKNASFRYALEVLCALKDLDFDFRYGVVYVTTPLRLWSTDPGVGLPAKNRWETQVLAGDDLKIAGKLPTIRITTDLQNAPLRSMLDYWSEISGLKFQADAAISEQPISLKGADLRLSNLLQLLTLPAGWDARIENGAVIISERLR